MRGVAQEADVAIIGAGPSGAATALLLARAGVDVLLVDRRTFPRAKACGDCLSPQATTVLGRLGVLSAIEAARPARLAGWRIIAPAGAALQEQFAAVCSNDSSTATSIALERARLDTILLEAARAAGARVLAPVHVQTMEEPAGGARVLTGRQCCTADVREGAPPRANVRVDIRTSLVIGADGLRSIIARRAGALRGPPGRRKFSLTGHVTGVHGITTLGEMHVLDGLCVGVAPVTSGDTPLCNVTLVADADRFARVASRDTLGFYWNILPRFPAIRGRLEQARLTQPLLASGPFDWPGRRSIAPRLALVGDAVGYFDPFTGQGIYQALAGAELLATSVAQAIRSHADPGAALREYAHALARLLAPAKRLQQLIDEVLRRPRLADFAIGRLAKRPTAARALLAATADLRPASTLLSARTLLSFAGPRWMERLL